MRDRDTRDPLLVTDKTHGQISGKGDPEDGITRVGYSAESNTTIHNTSIRKYRNTGDG